MTEASVQTRRVVIRPARSSGLGRDQEGRRLGHLAVGDGADHPDGSAAFGQLLSFSGVTPALTQLAVNLPVEPIVVLILMQVVVIFLGMFIEQTSIVMVTIPTFMPIVAAMAWDPVWFGAIMLLNLELATISPPFGLSLFVMKGIASPGTTMGDLYRAALPFVGLNFLVMGLMIGFPPLVLWLPSLMR
jgi:TRAP-type C4-dicarboxylate transport system permease large subunit